MSLMHWAAVAAGGALGAMLRYGLSGWAQGLAGVPLPGTLALGGLTLPAFFPLGTLVVNVLGSFILGAVLQVGMERFLMPVEIRLLLATGFCGSLTTFSTFSYETLNLIEEQQWAAAGGNILINVVVCLAATYAGLLAARLV